MPIVWSDGYAANKYKNVNPEKVFHEIEEIGERATPQEIVDRARDENSELHRCFTWDDGVAANNWRKQEARLIRGFLKFRSDTDEDAPEIHAFYFTGVDDGYISARKVFTIPDEYAALLKRAYAELHAFSKKYHTLKDDLGDILELIEQLP